MGDKTCLKGEQGESGALLVMVYDSSDCVTLGELEGSSNPPAVRFLYVT